MIERHDIPPVEPLPETSWRRVERDLFAELDRSSEVEPKRAASRPLWRRPGAGAAVAAAVAAAALILWVALDRADRAPHPSRIVTDDAPAAITVGRAAIQVGPESALWVHSGNDREVMVVLEAGRVDCAVAHDERQPPLVVQAGDVRVEVVGTRFAVWRAGGSARVSVREGAVQVYHDGQRVIVEAGETWPDLTARAGAADVPVDPPASAAAGEEEPGEVTGEADPVEAVAEDEKPGEAAPGGGEGRPPQPASTRADEPGPPPKRPRRAKERGRAAPAQASPKAEYERAAGLEATEPRVALSIYRALARGDSPWAANALFAQARLELEQGRTRTADALLRRYLERFPRGPNAADARALLAQPR